jgi:recombinational DNA repair protein (RecF pathway)
MSVQASGDTSEAADHYCGVSMKQLVTSAIILHRTDYGEADRILTLLTPQYGKLTLMAKGVRKIKSKLAGGIELFSVSEITFIKGRGAMGTLVSSRLNRHYAHIVTDIDRTMYAYELIKQLNRATEDETEEDYFILLQQAFEALDDKTVPLDVIRFWFTAQLLRLGGHTPNLQTDEEGKRLEVDAGYTFGFEAMGFRLSPQDGPFRVQHIKVLRLAFAGTTAPVLSRIQGGKDLCSSLLPLAEAMLREVA